MGDRGKAEFNIMEMSFGKDTDSHKDQGLAQKPDIRKALQKGSSLENISDSMEITTKGMVNKSPRPFINAADSLARSAIGGVTGAGTGAAIGAATAEPGERLAGAGRGALVGGAGGAMGGFISRVGTRDRAASYLKGKKGNLKKFNQSEANRIPIAGVIGGGSSTIMDKGIQTAPPVLNTSVPSSMNLPFPNSGVVVPPNRLSMTAKGRGNAEFKCGEISIAKKKIIEKGIASSVLEHLKPLGAVADDVVAVGARKVAKVDKDKDSVTKGFKEVDDDIEVKGSTSAYMDAIRGDNDAAAAASRPPEPVTPAPVAPAPTPTPSSGGGLFSRYLRGTTDAADSIKGLKAKSVGSHLLAAGAGLAGGVTLTRKVKEPEEEPVIGRQVMANDKTRPFQLRKVNVKMPSNKQSVSIGKTNKDKK